MVGTLEKIFKTTTLRNNNKRIKLRTSNHGRKTHLCRLFRNKQKLKRVSIIVSWVSIMMMNKSYWAILIFRKAVLKRHHQRESLRARVSPILYRMLLINNSRKYMLKTAESISLQSKKFQKTTRSSELILHKFKKQMRRKRKTWVIKESKKATQQKSLLIIKMISEVAV